MSWRMRVRTIPQSVRYGIPGSFGVMHAVVVFVAAGIAMTAIPAGTEEVRTTVSVPDSSFEQGTAWDFGRDPGIASLTEERAFSGRRSLKVRDVSKTKGSSVTSGPIPLPGEGVYELRGMVFPVTGE